MKRVKLNLLVAFLTLSLCACSSAKDNNAVTSTPATQVTEAVTTDAAGTDSDETGNSGSETTEQNGAEADNETAENGNSASDSETTEATESVENTDASKTEDTSEAKDNEEENMEDTNQNTELEEQDKAEETDTKYAFMTGSSIITTGNNYRFKQFMAKVRSGEHVNIVTLGGSITEGGNASPMSEGYAYKFAEAFESTYGGDITFVNAGLSGTPSSLGVMRYQKDVIDKLDGGTPDLLIIEFAVNDWQEATNGRGYESLIYQALTDNPDCAVILLFTVTSKDWNLQKDMMPYGYYYKLPMVSMQNALKYPAITSAEYFSDEFHPTNKGHIVMKDCLMALIEKMDNEEISEPFELPEEAKKGRDFMHMELVVDGSETVDVERGSFTGTDTEIQNFQVKKEPSFPDNYMHEAGSNDSLVMKMECSTILLDYKTSSNSGFGEAVVLVDGQEVTTLNGYSAGGWNNSNVVLILDEQESAEHTLEIRMVEGQEDKKFTVLGVSVN